MLRRRRRKRNEKKFVRSMSTSSIVKVEAELFSLTLDDNFDVQSKAFSSGFEEKLSIKIVD